MKEFIDQSKIVNKYHLDVESINKIVTILNDYICKIHHISLQDLSLREQLSYIGLLSELYPILIEKEQCLKLSQELLVSLREKIYNKEFSGISLYDGICNLAVFVKNLNINSGCYNKFCKSIDEIILEKTHDCVKKLMVKKNVSFWDFDTICGLAGISNYLLDESADQETKETLKAAANYFVSLCSKTSADDGQACPPWVRMEREAGDDYIDFSLAHGIAGPLQIMVRMIKKNIIVEGQIEAIIDVIDEYEAISKKAGCSIWADKILKENYANEYIAMVNQREGWCYGSISVAMVLLDAAKIVHDKYLYEKAYNRLIEVSQMEINELGLDNPILCHGYAGTSAVFRNLYEVYEEPAFRKQAVNLISEIIKNYTINSRFGFPMNDIIVINEKQLDRSCDKLDFLEGSAGIVMELASWIKEDSKYEKMLLIK